MMIECNNIIHDFVIRQHGSLRSMLSIGKLGHGVWSRESSSHLGVALMVLAICLATVPVCEMLFDDTIVL